MTLHTLSPLDGRYEKETSPLQDYFSEFAFFRARARLELDFLSALAKIDICPPVNISLGVLTEADFKSWIEAIDVDEETRNRLQSLSPESYIGLAIQITDEVIASGFREAISKNDEGIASSGRTSSSQ